MAGDIRVYISVLIALISYVVSKAYRARRFMYTLCSQGLPMPPYHWLTGHWLIIIAAKKKLPLGAHSRYMFADLAEQYGNGMLYVDFWPLMGPMLIITTPITAHQMTAKPSQTRPDSLNQVLDFLTGGSSLLSAPDDEWRLWRRIFNPAFSASSILAQMPKIVPKTQIFREVLREQMRKQSLIQLDVYTTMLTLDVIGAVALDAHFDCQRSAREDILDSDKGAPELPHILRSIIEWGSFSTSLQPSKRYNPMRPVMQWYYSRKIDLYLHRELDKRFEEHVSLKEETKKSKATPSRSIIACALDHYLASRPGTPPTYLDQHFRRALTSQIRLFVMAGHDTTASALTYAYHLLYTNPSCIARLRKEHDEVFGPNTNEAAEKLVNNPNYINNLLYTDAVVKETLRLFPSVSSIRAGRPDTILTGQDGTKYPTEGCSVYSIHLALHRSTDVWPKANSFVPERWLADPGDPLYPPKGAWRPFEWGPRNCIGQTLALVEIKAALVMTVRDLDIEECYEEWNRLHGQVMRGTETLMGDRAFQVEGGAGAARPLERYPCRVKAASM